MSNPTPEQKVRLNKLTALGLNGMSEALENQYENEVEYSAVTFDARLDFLIQRQEAYKKDAAYRRLIHQGKLR